MGSPLLLSQSRKRKTEKKTKTKNKAIAKQKTYSFFQYSKFGAKLFIFKEVYLRSSQSVLPNLNT